MEKKYHKVAILSGGLSAEREVSLVSARGSYDALIRLGYDAHLIDPADKDFVQKLIDLKPEAVLNMLHGNYGEDGTVQGVLEYLRIPYSHSNVGTSAIAMDKAATKALLSHHGLPVAISIEGTVSEIIKNKHKVPFPAVLKPVSEGSSVGVFILEKPEDLPPRMASLDNKKQYMLEKYIVGREMTVAVLDGRALAVTEIIANDTSFYDYKAKYAKGGSSHIIPAELPEEVYNKMLDYASKAHKVLGCRGVSRTDFRYNPSDSHGIIILEVNTQPGMTPTSLVPEQAIHVGISYDELVQILIEGATCLHA